MPYFDIRSVFISGLGSLAFFLSIAAPSAAEPLTTARVRSVIEISTAAGIETVTTNLDTVLDATAILATKANERVVIRPTIIERTHGSTRVMSVTEATATDGSTYLKTNSLTVYGGSPGKGALPGINHLDFPLAVVSENEGWKRFQQVRQLFNSDESITFQTNTWVEFKTEAALEDAQEAAPTVRKRGAHARELTRWLPREIAPGKYEFTESSYTELATGLSYRDETGQWQDAVAEFEVVDGAAVAQRTQHKVSLRGNPNGEEPVLVTLPDGNQIRSRVLGLGYFDRKTGASVIIAQLKDSQGEVSQAKDEVIYRNAFEGLDADLRYVLTKDGLEQDIVLNEAPLPPEDYGLDSANVQLEALTEFFPTVDPQITPFIVSQEQNAVVRSGMAEPDLVEHMVDFGTMRLARGQAFAANEKVGAMKPAPGIGMTKRWEKIEGRNILFEAVPHADIKPVLDTLPQRAGAGTRPEASLHRKLPSTRMAVNAGSKAMALAQSAYQSKGLVLDYVLSGSISNFTLTNGATYHVTGNVTLSGSTTIQGGAIVKYASGKTLSIWDYCSHINTTPRTYFVSERDNSIGASVVSGAPTGTFASTALAFNYLQYYVTLSNIEIRNASIGVSHYYSTGSLTVNTARLLELGTGFYVSGTSMTVNNPTSCRVTTLRNDTYNIYLSGNTTSCLFCTGDDYENSMGGAASITPGTGVSANIDCNRDEDFFYFTLSASAWISAYTTGSTDTFGHLVDAWGNEVQASDSGGSGNNFRLNYHCGAGTYYVRVRHASSTGTGSYTLNVEQTASSSMVTAVTAWDYFRNDYPGWVGFKFTVGSSPLVVTHFGRWVTGASSASHAVKLFSAGGTELASTTVNNSLQPTNQFAYGALGSAVTLSANTTYVLMSQEANGGDLWFNGWYTSISVSSAVGNVYSVYAADSTPGTYTTQFSGMTYGPLNILYTVSTGDLHGNNIATATTMSPNSSQTGSINSAGDEDFFKLIITQPGILEIFTTGTTDTYAELQNPSGGVLSSNDDAASTNQNFYISSSVAVGTYYVRVKHSSSSGTGGYTLSAVFEPSTGSGAMVTAVSAFGASRNDYRGGAGVKFTVGNQPVTVTHLGRYVLSGNNSTHLLKLLNADGTSVSNGEAVISMTNRTSGQFAYQPLVTPVVLNANTAYMFMSEEWDTKDYFHNHENSSFTLNSAFGSPYSAYAAWSVWTGYVVQVAGQIYGTVNLKFHTPNTAPTVSDIPTSFVQKDGSTGINFTVADAETLNSLSLSAVSSDPAKIPNSPSNLAFSGSGANRTLTVTPATGQTGNVTITVTVTDPAGLFASDSFTATIQPKVPTPTFSPTFNTDHSQGTITASTSEAGATMYYTVDGSIPTSTNPNATTTVPVRTTATTVKARAYKTGFIESDVATFTLAQAASVTFSPALHQPTQFTSVPLSLTMQSQSTATIKYKPGTGGSFLTGTHNTPVSIDGINTGSGTVEAYAFTSTTLRSANATSGQYNFKAGTPAATAIEGTSYGQIMVTAVSATPSAAIRYSIDGSTPTTSSLLYAAPFANPFYTVLKFKAFKTGYAASDLRTCDAIADPDSDGLPNWAEDLNGNGLVDSGETDFMAPNLKVFLSRPATHSLLP